MNTDQIKQGEIIRCANCAHWDREHIQMYRHSDEHPDREAAFAECMKWSDWSRCMLLREDDYCSQSEAVK